MSNIKKIDFPSAFLATALCAFGLFHEFLACVSGIVLCIYLLVYTIRKRTINVYINLCSGAVLAITVGYLISIFYAVDKGATVIGFVKYLPVLLYLLVLMQQDKSFEDYLKVIPPIACFMTVVSAVLMQIPVLTSWFSVSGRLAGFFQYANTFALFLLVAFIITATKEKLSKIDYLYIAVFVFGILYSGSRTVFVLSIVALAAVIIFGKNKKNKIVFISAALGITAIAFLYAVITDNFDTIGRFMTMSLKESTFVGRFLYFIDALPVILKHPFGMGYLGYYYTQQSFQTGVYTVKFIHNDFLQLLLDIGFIPVIIFAASIVRAFLKKGGSIRKRLLILIITAHCCFDFDLQFLAFFMLFVMLLDYKDGMVKEIRISPTFTGLVAAVLSVLFVYIGTSQTFQYFRKYDIATKIYPWDTFSQVKILEEADLSEKTKKLSDNIIAQNEYIAIAYNKKAQIAYSQGDFEKVIEYKKKVAEFSVFSYDTQIEYCYMLINGIYLYTKNNDDYSINVCQQELIKTVNHIQSSYDRLSELGKMIDDQPETQLPEDIMDYVGRLMNEKS